MHFNCLYNMYFIFVTGFFGLVSGQNPTANATN